MNHYKGAKGFGYLERIAFTALVDVIFLGLIYSAETYEFIVVVELALLIFNLFQLYYILLHFTLIFSFNEDNFYIKGNFGIKKVTIPLYSIEQYFITHDSIKGIKLSGHGNKHFAMGRTYLEDIGTTNMFVTSNSNIIYIKTKEGNYAFSPENIKVFEDLFKEHNIINSEWIYVPQEVSEINKEKKFRIPLIVAGIITIILVINPFIWYLFGEIPKTGLPLAFSSDFQPVKIGNIKQFLFKQTSYGFLSMAFIFCMYFAAYFWGKYDKKIAYRYSYFAIALAITFLLMQFKILFFLSR